MAQPRLASRAPAACAACYAQHPDRQYVDFAAALEGRLVDPSKPRGGHVDWVIICEGCLRAAVALLPEQADRSEQFKRRAAQLEERATKAEAYADQLEGTLAARPKREHVQPKAKAGRQSRYAPKGDQ